MTENDAMPPLTMGCEVSPSTYMLGENCEESSAKPSNAKEPSSRHGRSMSAPFNGVKEDILDILPRALYRAKLDLEQAKGSKIGAKNERSPTSKLQCSMTQEIRELENRLKDQFIVRQALEKALGYRYAFHDPSNENSMPKTVKELIKEIAVLELEVMHWEHYLLSLYRKAFDQQVMDLSSATIVERSNSTSISQAGLFLQASGLEFTPKRVEPTVRSNRILLLQDSIINPFNELSDIGNTNKQIGPGVQRSHSSLSQRTYPPMENLVRDVRDSIINPFNELSGIGNTNKQIGPGVQRSHSSLSQRTCRPMENLVKDVRACHSQPLSFLKNAQTTQANVISLAEHLGTSIADHVPETSNRLSEDVIRSMAAIYCKLADPPLIHVGLLASPTSSLSSISTFSPQNQCDMWSPLCKKEVPCNMRLENPFHTEGLQDFNGPYSTMVEVPWICADGQRANDVEHMLQNYRSLVHRLEKIDIGKMQNEEKLAFWINIHNALVMHAYLAYGIPQNNQKRLSLLLKAAYNIGGRTINADKIRSSILGCRTNHPRQWLRTIFSTRTKFKVGDDRQAYSIQHPEPLLHFALSLGCYSDPAVRMYTAKRVFQELEVAKEEYIQATVGISKDQKILLPKILESYARDSCLSTVSVVDMVQHCLPEARQKAMKRSQQRSHKNIQWVPHSLAFRHLLSKELTK